MLNNVDSLVTSGDMVETLARVVHGRPRLLAPVCLRQVLSQNSAADLLHNKLGTISSSVSILDTAGEVLFGSLTETDTVRYAIESEENILGWVHSRPQESHMATMLARLLSLEAVRGAEAYERHQLLRIFADASTEAMHILDRDLKILFINRVALEALQSAFGEIQQEDVIGEDLRQVYPFLGEQGLDIKLATVVETGVAFREEIRVVHPAWGVLYLDLRAFKVGEGLGIMVTDITERKLVEDKLQVSEERLRSTLTSLDDLVFTLDRNGEFTEYFQPPSADLIVPPEVFIGKALRDILPPHVARLTEETVELAIKTDAVQQFDYSLILDGEEQWFDAKISNQKDANGDVRGTTIVVRNINERKLAEEQRLRLMLEQERTKIITDFVRQASHEFRTPLAIITTNAYLLATVVNPDQRQQCYGSIDAQVRNLVRLVDNMLLLVRLDSGHGFALNRIDLNQVLRGIYRLRRPEFHEKGFDCRCELSEDHLFAQGNTSYFELAIEHLLANAVVHSRPSAQITIRSQATDDHVIVEIADTGSGISQDDLPHIFKRFYRADKAGTKSGFGLGLPIVQGIVERLGGRVEVETALGEGSTFRLILPAA